MNTVTISDAPLSLEELVAVVDWAPVELGPAATARIEASRAVVDAVLASGEPVYGLNTQVGHGKDVRLTDDAIRAQQHTLLMTHAGGVGAPLPTPLVRAALAVRLNGIARGGSGASLGAARTLAAMLNAGVHPVMPETSGVGTGDLGQMAEIGQVAVGAGTAEYRGEILAGGEALRRAGIPPLELGPKDGLALISANAVSVGSAVLAVQRAAGVAEVADVCAALSMEAVGGNVSVLHPAVAAAKPFPGQIATADHVRDVLAESYLLQRGAAHSVQDPLSFRVVPQVHGALRDYIGWTRRAVEVELNSASDNPLVSLDDETLISNGNFHPLVLAIAFDALRVALAHVGQLSERRMSHLWDTIFELLPADEPPPGDAVAPPSLFGLQLRYPAAAVFPELKQLAGPATLDVPPLDIGVEDHATGAPLSVRKTSDALGLLEDLLAIELLLARDVLAAIPVKPVLGRGTRSALRDVDQAIERAENAAPATVHRAVRAALSSLAAGNAAQMGPLAMQNVGAA